MDKSTTTLAHAAQQIGFQEYLHSVTESGARIARLEQALRDTLPEWSLRPLVQALQDFLRFENPRHLMAYVGLVGGSTPRGPSAARAASPRRATVPRGACWWRWPGITSTARG